MGAPVSAARRRSVGSCPRREVVALKLALRGARLAALAACLAPAPAWASEPASDDDLPPNYLRPAVEIAAGLAAASTWYVIDRRNVLDWDYPSAEERLNGEAWRFDNNTFALNYVWHPLAGSGMYVLARGNRLGPWPSFLYSFAGSTTWEYVIEFNEKVSINDMIVTPVSGLAVGEFFHKLALHLSDAPPRSATEQALAWTLGLSVHGHRRLDGSGPSRRPSWRDLKLGYGFGVVETSDVESLSTHLVGFDGTFVSLPGYGMPGRWRGWYDEAEFASFELEVDAGAEGLGLDTFAETRLAGYHFQDLSGSRRHARGISAGVGIGVAYAYRNTEGFGYDDRQGLLLAPGIVGEVSLRQRALRFATEARFYPSFGSMSSPAFARWRRSVADGRIKTVLQREGYLFGYGVHASGEARVGYRSLELRAELGYDRFVSIEGLDRTQELVVHDPHGREKALSYAVSFWLTELPVALELGIGVEGRLRTSRLPGTEERVDGRRSLIQVRLPL